MDTIAEKDTGLIAYCGLCCADCQGYKGTIPGLAKNLRKELKKAKYETFASEIAKLPFGKPFKHYQDCYDLLGLMAKFRCRKGCRNNGGPPSCRIRECCREKGIAGCWECGESERCDRLAFLSPVHGNAHLKNIGRIRKNGVEAFLAGKRDW
jgi:hypothetical protein